MTAPFPSIDPAAYAPHRLHDQDRLWPETNCYVDLWIEILSAAGLEPEAMLGFTLTQDFEGDQFTFFKPSMDDVERLYGIINQELTIYNAVERHVTVQIGLGKLCLIEMDSFYLPDTQGLSYRTEHGKTTVAMNRLDVAAKRLDYFHGRGYWRLEGEDFDGLFKGYAAGSIPFLPFSEVLRFGPAPSAAKRRDTAEHLLVKHFARRPTANPIPAFAAVLPAQAEEVATASDPGFFHKYAFSTLRQLGANFELLADHLMWIGDDYGAAAGHAHRVAEVAKAAQFQLARACARRKFDGLTATLSPAVEAYDALMADLQPRLSD
jgi:hypothetical protein